MKAPDSQREALREAEERLAEERRMFFSGPVVVFQWKNAPGWPVEYVSPNAEQVFGYTAREFLDGDISYAEIVHPDDLERVANEVRDASESGTARFAHEPYRFHHRNGEVGWLDDYTTVLRAPDGTVDHYLGYVIDATERKLFEEESAKLRAQVLHAQKLESLGVLAGGIAHDFNNLLTGILGYAALLASKPADEKAARSIEMIETAAMRASDLCQQMLAYSGRGKFQVGSHDLNALIEEMAHLLEVSISKSVELRYELAPALPAVQADATQIRQLMMNLITNASEAIGTESGVITLKTGAVGSNVFARVTDDGCGMDEETRARIFDPFFTTKVEGRGLGMAAALGILRGHHGSIEIDSEVGEGTTVEIRLPASAEEAANLQSAPAFDTGWQGSGTALVIDDEEIIRLLARNVLERAGFQVRTAVNGTDGIALLREVEGDVAVVLLDLTMPGMDGLDTLAELKQVRPNLPVVLTSGFNREEVAARLDPKTRTPFLKKPFQPRELLVLVRQAMEQGLPARPIRP